MYNTNDIETGVSIRECFHAILENALEEKDINKKEEYFDILRRCLGIDFSMIYDADGGSLLNIDCYYDTEISYEVLLNEEIEKKKNNFKDTDFIDYMHNEINKIFNSIKSMVKDGNFSENYYKYLKSRQRILEDLIHYYNLFSTMLPVNDFMLFNRITTNSSITDEKQKNEIKEMIDILSNDKSNANKRKIEALVKTKELLNSRIEEVEAKRLTLKNS